MNKSIGKIVHEISLQLQLYERNVKELIKQNENNKNEINKLNEQIYNKL